MKTCKLVFHQKPQQKNVAGEDLMFCPKDLPFVKENDVIELYHPDDEEEEECPRLLLKVMKGNLKDDFAQKDVVSIEQSIASTFQFKSFTDVVINKVDPRTVELDSIELTFKDSYLGRSDMWRLKNSLVGCCVHIGKKFDFVSNVRCHVYELWSGGDKVSSGLITESTKIVFRSSTSMVYLFIQMSSEMWEFDIYGDLYFEKAVNGFLSELFTKWKQNGSNHEVTIVLFSRVYYYSSSLEQFPEVMRECLQTDYRGRSYEDFYRVVIQNEKYDDWRNTLINLRHIFVDYHEYLLNFHKRNYPNIRVPRAAISSAAQGNFLEVLNMSLNVFEKHFVDRSFDRTGQLSVVITPGVGVFEVDRELTNVTMQRVIDNGVGSDLVCVGEQPLHAVPLLKFHNKATHQNNVDDYSMPHWINLSFYSTNKRVGYATYIPRIKLPTRTITYQDPSPSSRTSSWKAPTTFSIAALRLGDETSWPNSIYDFDNYDESIFRPSSSHGTVRKKVKQTKRPTNLSEGDFSKIFLRQNSEPEMHQSTSDLGSLHNVSSTTSVSSSMVLPSTQPSLAITIPSKTKLKQIENLYSSSFGALNIELKSRVAANANKDKWFSDDLVTSRNTKILSPANSSHGCSPKDKDLSTKSHEIRRPSRSLINPFDPSHAVIKLTSNRRRWTHIFPRGPTGTLIQQHHFPSGVTKLDMVPEVESPPADNASGKHKFTRPFSRDTSDSSLGARMLTRLWGATGEQEWTPALTTGVDWKSMTIPACLPLTTDYFPDEQSLKIDYLVSDYNLLPDYVNADYSSQRAVYRRPLTTKEVFAELVSQRLAQGFQAVIRTKSEKPVLKQQKSLIRISNDAQKEEIEEHFMSIGRIFHLLSLSGTTITITRYRPRHPYPSIKIHYKYRFHAPNNDIYEVSYADFSTEKLENYNWNYLDHYICTRGDRDFALSDNLKYWRFRVLILPTYQGALKKILGESTHCNVYAPLTLEEKKTAIQDVLKFFETCINRIRRPNSVNSKTPRVSSGASCGSQSSTSSASGFRERVNSNQLNERPRMRSGSKLTDKQRQESGSGRLSPFESFDLKSISDPFLDLQNPLPLGVRNEVATEGPVIVTELKSDASHLEIIAAMRSQQTGFTFIKSSDLPHWTFVSHDAVTWLMSHMEGVETESQAVHVFSGMLKERLILHASGDSKHRFIHGFYLYFIITNDVNGVVLEPLISPEAIVMFHNEWMEVEVPCQPSSEDDVPETNKNIWDESHDTRSIFKDVYVDVDISNKSERQEWGHVKYQSVFNPEEAFEITIYWIQATGAIIADLVQGWSRKAQQCNLQLVPVPTDPFALPNSNNSDPLRGPISIPLHTQCLLDEFAQLNNGFSENEWKKNILYFQHSVALQFGFVRCPKHGPSPRQNNSEWHFVHTSGNMFIIIPTNRSILQTSFLWSWNYMSSKRWKTSVSPALGDDNFMFKLLKDFKEFCANEDGRLVAAWNHLIKQRHD